MRLAFEFAGVPYTEMNDAGKLLSTITSASKSGHPPHFAPPTLKLPSGRFLSQTAAILNHIGPKFGLAGKKEGDDPEELRSLVNQLVLTALDLSDEVSPDNINALGRLLSFGRLTMYTIPALLKIVMRIKRTRHFSEPSRTGRIACLSS